jgi:hypothetical protein
MKASTVVAKPSFPPGLRTGFSGFMPLPELLVAKPSSVSLFSTCAGGGESCMSVLARSDESRLRLPLEGFGVSYVGGIDLGCAAGSPRIMVKVRMFVAKAATMNHSRLSAGCILERKIERPTNVPTFAEPNARIPEMKDITPQLWV